MCFMDLEPLFSFIVSLIMLDCFISEALSTLYHTADKLERVNNFINIHNFSSAKKLNDLIKILHTKLNDMVETNSS